MSTTLAGRQRSSTAAAAAVIAPPEPPSVAPALPETTVNRFAPAPAVAPIVTPAITPVAPTYRPHRWLEGPAPIAPPEHARRRGPLALAVFCFETSDSLVGQYAHAAAESLARRQTPVHLFVRQHFPLHAPGTHMHVVGDGYHEDFFVQVQEFARRASNAFLQCFPAGTNNLLLLGHEWSSIPVLSLLHGIRNLPTVLSLHSLECQRSDMSHDTSRQIMEIERTGLREAKIVLVHDPRTAELARHWLPDRADRIVDARQVFFSQFFDEWSEAGIGATFAPETC